MKKLLIAFLFCLALTGCKAIGPLDGTGVGYAWNRAWYGVDPDVAESVVFMKERVGDDLRDKYDAVYRARVINPDGSLNQIAAENRFRDMALIHAEIERWEALSESLADYIGIDTEEPFDSEKKKADDARRRFWNNLQKGAREALKEIE